MKITLNNEEVRNGDNMLSFAKQLFPMNRSIMGPDIRKSYYLFTKKHKEFKEINLRSGEKVFDWVIPDEWIISDAYIKHESGTKFADFKKNNLHLMGYSEPVNLILSKKELLKKIYISNKLDNAIPYITSYYKRRWGFCISYNEYKILDERYSLNDKFRINCKCTRNSNALSLSS